MAFWEAYLASLSNASDFRVHFFAPEAVNSMVSNSVIAVSAVSAVTEMGT